MAIEQISGQATAAPSQATTRPARNNAPATELAMPTGRPQQPDAQQVRQALGEVQKAVESVARDLRFSIDKETGRTIVTVVDSVTQEVIRQIPGEEIVAIAKAMDRMQGLLLKQKA